MIVSFSLIGLALIIVAWIFEFLFMGKKRKISMIFMATYILGAGILVYDGFTTGAYDLGIANLICCIAAGIVLGKSVVEVKE